MFGFYQVLKGLGPVRLAAIGGVMLGVIGFFVYLMSQTSTGNHALLFSQVDPAEGAKILHRIESMDIPVTISPDGTSIYVPEEKVARLRMELAQEGLPGGGSLGYEIFDRGDVLSTSGSLIDINRLRALEGELSKSIRTISGVAAARVHLVLPKRELFSQDRIESTASIVLKMKGNGKLMPQQIQAIQNLVSAAVPGLLPERISIVDDKGNLLAKSQESGGFIQEMNSQAEIRRSYEQTVTKQLENLLEKTVGFGKVRVEVSAEIDFNETTTNTEKYDPDGQVIRSTTNTQTNESTESGDSGAVSIQNALPQEQSAQGGKNNTSNKRNEEKVDYEISRVVETHKKGAGSIKALSIAVLVDGVYAKDKSAKGQGEKASYAPRSKQDLEQLKMLVKTAIGYNEKRGDKVEVINMPFAQVDMEEAKEDSKSFMPQMDLTRIIELAVLAVVGILILMMIIRPVLLKVIENSGVVESDPYAATLLTAANGYSGATIPDYSRLVAAGGGGGATAIPGDYFKPGDIKMPIEEEDVEDDDMMLDIASIDGRVRASSLRKISDIVDKHPEEAVTIMRTWMYEEPWK